jgi:hypothetical protein
VSERSREEENEGTEKPGPHRDLQARKTEGAVRRGALDQHGGFRKGRREGEEYHGLGHTPLPAGAWA